ncbi:MAG TPA: hypothetical protein VM580_05555, partial [Labilithrix sp.]|nr:hypothetical protein [Labilithrix sp.]
VRYVKWAVAGASAVCLAALMRTTLSWQEAPTALAMPAVEAPVARKEAPTTLAAPQAAPAPTVAIAPAEPVASAVPEPEARPEPEPAGDAKQEKAKSLAALEQRKLAAAIEAGERAVRLDPTDAEAWLILGAAHQDNGNVVAARRAYASCVKEAKTGPRAECQNLLR